MPRTENYSNIFFSIPSETMRLGNHSALDMRQRMDKKEIMNLRALKKRSEQRRRLIVAHRAKSFKDAELWDLEFWQSQSPAERLAALVAIRNDIKAVRGKKRDFDWND